MIILHTFKGYYHDAKIDGWIAATIDTSTGAISKMCFQASTEVTNCAGEIPAGNSGAAGTMATLSAVAAVVAAALF